MASDWLGTVSTAAVGMVGIAGTLVAAHWQRRAQREQTESSQHHEFIQRLRLERRTAYAQLMITARTLVDQTNAYASENGTDGDGRAMAKHLFPFDIAVGAAYCEAALLANEETAIAARILRNAAQRVMISLLPKDMYSPQLYRPDFEQAVRLYRTFNREFRDLARQELGLPATYSPGANYMDGDGFDTDDLDI
jgi:hypothetical protein